MSQPESNPSPLPNRERLLALVDGIFAVSMTLLVLDIKLPEGVRFSSNQDLLQHFVAVEFSFAIYVVSFCVLAMFWIAHHFQFRFVDHLDRGLLWANLFFLLLTTLVPFTTSLATAHENLQLPVILYATNLLLLYLMLAFHLEHLRRRPQLATDQFTPEIGRWMSRRLRFFCVLPVVAVAVGFYSPAWGLRVFYLLALLHFASPWIDRYSAKPGKPAK